MSGPYQSEVYVPQPIGAEEEKKRRAEITKRAPRQPLYVYRAVENAHEIAAWAKEQGFTTVQENLHVTIAYSKEPVDWLKMGAPSTWCSPSQNEGDGRLIIPAGGPRVLTDFDKPGLAVMGFASSELEWRNREIRDRGASWDHDGYTPLITISWKAEGVDLDAVKPYSGRIILGPEIFEPINDDWKATNIEKKDGALRKAHIDQELGLVFGFAVVCKHNGQPYFDRQLGDDGKPFPDHIPEGSMLEASLDFAKNSRAAGDMHESIQEGGSVPFMIPLTSDLRKFIIENDTTGLLIGMAPNADVLAKFKSGDYSGFSIGGMRIEDTEIEA